MRQWSAGEGSVRIYTRKEGLLSKIAHDLCLEVGRFSIELDEEQVRGEFWVESIEVVEAMEHGQLATGVLSSSDKRKIAKNMRKDVLEVRRHPKVVFESSQLTAREDGGYRVEGWLEMAGARRAIELEVQRSEGELVARKRLHQPDWGIKPYSAMMGTLKVGADLEVELRLAVGE